MPEHYSDGLSVYSIIIATLELRVWACSFVCGMLYDTYNCDYNI